jgi:DNA-binding GntR family transcriptional regulator
MFAFAIFCKIRKGEFMSDHLTEAYEALREKILSGEYRPNQRLTEAQVVRELGISRSHARNAFQRLSFDGLIDLQPNQGAAVSDVTLDDILDVFVAREALELEAYRRAFTRIDEAGLTKLEELIQQMQQAIADDDYDVYSTAARHFRNTILEIADSQHVKELADSLLRMSSRVVLRKIMIPLRGKGSLVEHEQIFVTLQGDNLEDLEQAFRNHISNLKDDIVRYWDIVKP